jgi:hypothetical protein
MTTLLAVLIVVAVLWLVWRFIKNLWIPQQPAGPIDPDSRVPVTPRRGPKERGGAVALEEPDEEDFESFPPRYQ